MKALLKTPLIFRRPQSLRAAGAARDGLRLLPIGRVLVAGAHPPGVGAGAIPGHRVRQRRPGLPAGDPTPGLRGLSTAWVIPGLIGPRQQRDRARPLLASGVPRAAAARRAGGVITFPALTRSVPVVEGDDAHPPEGRAGRPVVLTLAVGAVLVAISGVPPWVAVPLFLARRRSRSGLPRLVPEGTARLAPGIRRPSSCGDPHLRVLRCRRYVSLTFQDVRGQPTWVAGAALTGCTIFWTVEPGCSSAGSSPRPRRVVNDGVRVRGGGIAGMVGALGRSARPGRGGVVGRRLRHRPGVSPLAVTVPRARRAGPAGRRVEQPPALRRAGHRAGSGARGAFVALGEAQGWATRSALALAFPSCSASRCWASRRPAASLPPSRADLAPGSGHQWPVGASVARTAGRPQFGGTAGPVGARHAPTSSGTSPLDQAARAASTSTRRCSRCPRARTAAGVSRGWRRLRRRRRCRSGPGRSPGPPGRPPHQPVEPSRGPLPRSGPRAAPPGRATSSRA